MTPKVSAGSRVRASKKPERPSGVRAVTDESVIAGGYGAHGVRLAPQPMPADGSTPPLVTLEDAAAVWAPIDALRPWADNPRDNSKAIAKVAASIKRFGFSSPIIARLEGEVIAGHTRLLASKGLAVEYAKSSARQRTTWHADAVRVATRREVCVRYLDISPEEAKLLAVADNRVGEEAVWDKSKLASILSDFTMDDALATGFDSGEIDKLFAPNGDGARLALKEIDVSEIKAEFFLTVSGPLPAQIDALEALKVALAKLPGVTVNMSATKL